MSTEVTSLWKFINMKWKGSFLKEIVFISKEKTHDQLGVSTAHITIMLEQFEFFSVFLWSSEELQFCRWV